MINSIDNKYLNDFNRIGIQVNDNFDKLFNLTSIKNDLNNDLIGYFENDTLVGFIHVIKLVDELEIINVVVDNEYRRKGIGSKLIESILSKYSDYKAIFLEVNVNNTNAIKLYEKYGFRVINIRKHYYGNDDCYVMRKEI